MRTWSLYDAATGLFTGRVIQGPDEAHLRANTPQGQAALEGLHDHVTRRVVDRAVVAREAPADHAWVHSAEKFVPVSRLEAARADAAARARIAEIEKLHGPRALREALLVAMPHGKERDRIATADSEVAELRPSLREAFNL